MMDSAARVDENAFVIRQCARDDIVTLLERAFMLALASVAYVRSLIELFADSLAEVRT